MAAVLDFGQHGGNTTPPGGAGAGAGAEKNIRNANKLSVK